MPPPSKIRLHLKGDARRRLKDFSGLYNLKPSLKNSTYSVWEQDLGNNCIWFDIDSANWKVCKFSDIALRTCVISGPVALDDWPNEIQTNWKFADGLSYIKAGKQVTFKEGMIFF